MLKEALKETLLPTRQQKEALAQRTGLQLHQVTVWFNNNRKRVRDQEAKSGGGGARE